MSGGDEVGDSAEITYLDLEDVLGLYADIVGCSDLEAADQLLRRDRLEAAIERPRNHAHYMGADLAEQAAVLAHGIAEAQAFVDGNKRTALAAMRTFLLVNGWSIRATQAERAEWILAFSRGAQPQDLARTLRERMVSRD